MENEQKPNETKQIEPTPIVMTREYSLKENNKNKMIEFIKQLKNGNTKN